MSVVVPFRRAEPVPVGTGAASLVHLHAAVAAARRRHRRLVAAAGRWALSRGVPLPADHVALWAAAAGQSRCLGDVGGLTGPWYASDLDRFLRGTVEDWCAVARCSVPADLPESLGYLYGFLADTGRLHRSSDSLTDLRAALAVAARPGHRLAPDLPPVPGPTAA